MELFNFGVGEESTDKQTYKVIKDRIGLTEEEFNMLPEVERKEWVDACRLALVLFENKYDELYNGYKETEMFSSNANFNLAAAVEIIRSKKRALDAIERDKLVDLTPAQFILMGDDESKEFIEKALSDINLNTAKELDN